ncbi:MAG: response regulator transcription factor [Proteobacteria bacterium]|nr:response regulator transcription factor [Pseudomonadota bacterium]
MLPKSLALVDDDHEYGDFLCRHLRELGVEVELFTDSVQLLASTDAFDFAFYVVDLMLPGIDGANLIKVLRQRTNVGVLVVSGRPDPDAFSQVVAAGADMYLAKPVHFEQVVAAVKAIHRRTVGASAASNTWTLDRRASQLIAPDGVRVDLGVADLAIIESFVAANGAVVERDELRRRIGRDAPEQNAPDGVTATIYRLRRRVERGTPLAMPLQSKSRVGYEFRAPLKAI